ncbi:MAG: hypothetical protein WCS28_12370 [Thiomicrospira sp.]|jgi:hypothetical protein
MDPLKQLSDQINSSQVAELLGTNRGMFNSTRMYLDGFPASIGKDRKAVLYSRRAVKKWMQGKDVKKLINAAKNKRNKLGETGSGEQSLAFNAAAAQFLTRPLTKKQREQQAFKRLVARNAKAKTTRITLIPDWTLDERITGRNRS